ncbi:MAG: SCO family protein [Bdellovibrionales bacterium CG10_big_fil_rev_8_21_14_0_10_45_34]|nr:MAG: SCO family protein [Bdellovibrionales bacterium CG10_big_fil_rev_8_21_14_0_10_45_34]
MLQLMAFMFMLPATTSFAQGLPWSGQKAASEKPAAIEDIGIEERLGETIDRNLQFTDDRGRQVTLGQYFDGTKPTLLSLVYYSCPNLCNFHLNGLLEGLKELKWNVGEQFNLVTVSIDPNETPELAAKKKENYLKAYGRADSAEGWNFLVGKEDHVKALASQVGFKYKWDPIGQQWAHGAAAFVVTPSGVISRTLFGIAFPETLLRLSLVEASEGKVGSVADKILLFCFHYDPAQRGYAFYAFNIMRAAGAVTVLVLGFFLVGFWRKQKVAQA